MRRRRWVLAFVCLFFGFVQTAQATVQIRINIGTQTMAVTTGSGESYVWPVSTGMSGYATPNGTYGVQRMMAVAYSNIYSNAPMPHSIFFSGGYAIHGSYAVGLLGRPASHGCVRLAPGNAATLFSLVRAEGAVISISGSSPTVYTASRSHGIKKAYVAAGYKHRKAVRLAKLNRSKLSGYLAYAPPPRGTSLKAWLKHPNRRF